MTEGIMNSDGSRNWQANILLDNVKRLEQENKDLKKQIESDKGLITVGSKQQYQCLQRIDELEQENNQMKSTLEEIRKMFLNQVAWVGQLTNFEEEIYNKINEVLK